MRRRLAWMGVPCAVALLVACEQRSPSVWLISGEIDAIGVRYGPSVVLDDTLPTVVALGHDARSPDLRVFAIRVDGALDTASGLEGPADRLIHPAEGRASSGQGWPSIAWVAREADGSWDFTVWPEGQAGVLVERVQDWWWRPGWRDSRIEIDRDDGVLWLDLATADSGTISLGAAVGVLGRDAGARTVYLEGDRLVARDADGGSTASSDAGVVAAAWMGGAIVFDTPAGLMAWSDPGIAPAVLDATGCVAPIAPPCDAERVLAGACGAHAYARFGGLVWESPCGAGAFVGAAALGAPTTELGESVIAARPLDDGRWIVVRGAAGAARGEAWLVDGSSAVLLDDDVGAIDPLVVLGDHTMLVAGELERGAASLRELVADGSLPTIATSVREVGRTGWLEGWDPSRGAGTLVLYDAATAARTELAEGVPAGGYREMERAPGHWLVIADAGPEDGGTLRMIDERGTILRTIDVDVTRFVEIAWGPEPGVAYARRGVEAGVHWQPIE